MQNVVLTVHLILAALLIGVVLLQRSEGGGLGMGSGGGGGGVMTGRQAANALSKATWILAGAFLITSLALFIIAGRQAGSGSVLDRIGGGAVTEPAKAPADGLPALPTYVPPPAAGQPITPPSPASTPQPAPAAPAPVTPPATPAAVPPATAAKPPAQTAPPAATEPTPAGEMPAPSTPAPAPAAPAQAPAAD